MSVRVTRATLGAGVVLVFASVALAQPQRPVLVETVHPTADYIIASAVLSPIGQEDAAPAIQAAVDEVAAAGGGVVFLSAGPYRLERPITVREGVTLRGDWAPPGEALARECTLLMIYAGKGQEDEPAAITLERGSGLREAVVWHPEQDAENVTPYPWTIHTSLDKGGDNYTVHNVTLVNPYKGIGVGPEWNELHTIRNVYGAPLSVGVFVDTCTDIGRLCDIRFDPSIWADSGLPGAPETDAERSALARQLSETAVAFDMGRSDWEYLRGLHVRGYRAGLRVREGAQGTTNAQMYDCHFTECAVGLELTHLNGVGLMATGCAFSATGAPVLGAPTLANTAVQLSSCRLEGLGECKAALVAEGDATFTLQHCELTGWNQAGARASAGAVALYGCTVTGPGVGMDLGPHVRLARALGSRFECPEPIAAACDAWAVQRADGGMGFAAPAIQPYEPPPDPRPRTAALIHVSDFAASPNATDNTVQLQAALDAAGDAGGGTVYIPAGLYRCSGSLIVPSGVEVRGCFDVPHHTMSEIGRASCRERV